MATEREVVVRLRITATGTELLDAAGNKLGELERKTKEVSEAGATGLARYATAATAIGAALAGAATAIVYATGRALEQQDQLGKLSQSIGLTTRDLSQLRVVAELGGVQMAELGQTMGLFNKQLVEASDTTSRSAKVLSALGVTAREPLPALLQVADAFKALGNVPERTAAALALFGRAGKDLIPILAQGSEEVRKLMGEADALGVTFDDKSAKAAEAFNDNIKRLGLAAEGLANQLATALAPVLASVTDDIVKWVEQNEKLLTQGVAAWVTAFGESIKTGLLPFLQDTLREINAISEAYATVQKRLNDRLFLNVQSGGSSSLDWQTGRGVFTTEGTTPTTEAQIAARERLARALAGGGGGGGGDPAAEARRREREEARRLSEEEKRANDVALAQQKASVELIDRQVKLREQSLDFAQQDLQLAQQQGASYEEQIRLAERIDQLEIERLEAVKARIQAELDRPSFTPEDVARAEELNTQLQLTTNELERVKAGFGSVADEIRRTRDVTIDLGATVNDALRRVIDGVLAGGGGGFNLKNIVEDTVRTIASSIIGGSLQAVLQGGQLNVQGFGGVLGKLFGGGPSSIVSTPGTGQFANVQAGGSSTAPAAGGLSGGAVAGIAGAAGGLLLAIQATINAFDEINKLLATGTVRKTFTERDIIKAGAQGAFGTVGLGGIGGLYADTPQWARILINTIFNPLGNIFEIPGVVPVPSQGAQIKEALKKQFYDPLRIPEQQRFELGEHRGIRTQFFEAAIDPLGLAAFTAVGYGPETNVGRGAGQTLQSVSEKSLTAMGLWVNPQTGLIEPRPGGPSPTRGANVSADEAARGGVLLELQYQRERRPDIEALRTGQILGLGQVITGDPAKAFNFANAVTNNFLLLGQSAEEVHRQLKKIADEAGVTLVSAIDELTKQFLSLHITTEQYETSLKGVLDFFTQDLPFRIREAIDIPALIERRTIREGPGAGAIDVAGLQGDLERFQIAYGLRQQAEQVRFQNQTVIQQERQRRQELAELDARLAGGGLSEKDRQELLQERAQIGFDLVAIAQQRYEAGSGAQRRAVEAGLAIVEDTAAKLEAIGSEIAEPTQQLTSATIEQTAAVRENTAALRGEKNLKLDVNIKGGTPELTEVTIRNFVRKAVKEALKDPEIKAGQKLASFNR